MGVALSQLAGAGLSFPAEDLEELDVVGQRQAA